MIFTDQIRKGLYEFFTAIHIKEPKRAQWADKLAPLLFIILVTCTIATSFFYSINQIRSLLKVTPPSDSIATTTVINAINESGVQQIGNNNSATQTNIYTNPKSYFKSSHWNTIPLLEGGFKTYFFFVIGNPGTTTPKANFPYLNTTNVSTSIFQRMVSGTDTETGESLFLKEWMVTFETKEDVNREGIYVNLEY